MNAENFTPFLIDAWRANFPDAVGRLQRSGRLLKVANAEAKRCVERLCAVSASANLGVAINTILDDACKKEPKSEAA